MRLAQWRTSWLRRLGGRANAFAVGARRDARNPLPAHLVEGAQVKGYESIRFWGDIYSKPFERMLVEKDRMVRAAAAAGIAPERVRETCYLSISGGGDRGAFAAGVLAGWSERGDRPCFEAVTGVSAGALAAPFAFLGPGYDASLHEIFTQNGPDQLFKARGLMGFFRDALNETTPLKALIAHYASDDFLDRIAAEHRTGRHLFVMTTNLDAQRPVIWCLSAIAASGRPDRRHLFVEVLRASSAMPGLFPPVRIAVEAQDGKTYDELHVDGGVTAELIFTPPEARILGIEEEIFGAPRERSLYVIENGKLAPEYEPVHPRLLSLTQRAVSTLVKYQVVDNLLALSLIMKTTHGRFYFHAVPADFDAAPAAPFDTGYAKKLYEAGRKVGRTNDWATTPPLSPRLGATRTGDDHHAAATVERQVQGVGTGAGASGA